jgi:hypothetical protein
MMPGTTLSRVDDVFGKHHGQHWNEVPELVAG